jgi:hypothetical protein
MKIMTIETNQGPIDDEVIEAIEQHLADDGDDTDPQDKILELQSEIEELEAIINRHARTVASYGLDFTDTGYLVIVDREKAVARLGEAAVERL